MFTRQVLYVGSNYVCTLLLLTAVRGSEFFFAVSALLIANGWIGSFFINRITRPEGSGPSRKDLAFLLVALIAYVVYLTRLASIETSLLMVAVLAVRVFHDFFRKRLFLLAETSEWIPCALKLSFASSLLLDLTAIQTILFYAAIYGASLAYYWAVTQAGLAQADGNAGHSKGGDLFIALRVSYRNLALLYLPFAYPLSSTVEEFLYWWALLSILAVVNDIIERYALRTMKAVAPWLGGLVLIAALIILSLCLSAGPEWLVMIGLVLTRQLTIGIENYRYLLERRKGSLRQLYHVEIEKIIGTICLFAGALLSGMPIKVLLGLFLVWEVLAGLILAHFKVAPKSK